jgi:hypothetical protein
VTLDSGVHRVGLVLLVRAKAPVGQVIRHNIDRGLRDRALDVGQPAQESLFDDALNVGLGGLDAGGAQVAAQLIDHVIGNAVCAHKRSFLSVVRCQSQVAGRRAQGTRFSILNSQFSIRRCN